MRYHLVFNTLKIGGFFTMTQIAWLWLCCRNFRCYRLVYLTVQIANLKVVLPEINLRGIARSDALTKDQPNKFLPAETSTPADLGGLAS